MPTCPGLRQLEQFLAGALSPAEEEALTQHVDRCGACQDTLEALVGGAGRPAPRDADAEPDVAFMQRLKDAAPSSPWVLPGAAPTPVPPSGAPDLLGTTVRPAGSAPVVRPQLPSIPGYEILGELGRGG